MLWLFFCLSYLWINSPVLPCLLSLPIGERQKAKFLFVHTFIRLMKRRIEL